MRPTLKVVLGSAGTWIADIFATARPIASIGFGHTKGAKTVATRPSISDAIAAAPDEGASDAQASAVNGYELIDRAFERDVEQLLHSPQVAQAFFADVSDERDRGRRSEHSPGSTPAMMPVRTARPRLSSPMPGPRRTAPSRLTLTGVPSGKTVSRWAATTTCG